MTTPFRMPRTEAEFNAAVAKAILRYDFFQFEFNDGRGIQMKQLSGLLTRDQLSPDAGLPVFVPSFTYDASSNILIGTINSRHPSGEETDHSEVSAAEAPALILIQIPADLPRTENTLSVELLDNTTNLDTLSLVDGLGNTVDASNLAAGSIVPAFWTATSLTVAGPLLMRPQDTTIRAAISEDAILTIAEINAGTSTTTDMLATPDWGAGVQRYVFVGWPADEDPITALLQGGFSDDLVAFETTTVEVDGYTWRRSVDTWDGEFSSSIIWTVER